MLLTPISYCTTCDHLVSDRFGGRGALVHIPRRVGRSSLCLVPLRISHRGSDHRENVEGILSNY